MKAHQNQDMRNDEMNEHDMYGTAQLVRGSVFHNFIHIKISNYYCNFTVRMSIML